ncbi:phage tail assembly chaperone [Enterococcus olivae]
MASVKDFMLQDLSVLEETQEIAFPQFQSPFVVRALTAVEFEQIQRESMIKKRSKKTGQTTTETDNFKLHDLVIANGVVTPDLQSSELQAHYKTAGAAKTARKMLKAGQYQDLAEAILELSGFDVDDMVEEVKNE